MTKFRKHLNDLLKHLEKSKSWSVFFYGTLFSVFHVHNSEIYTMCMCYVNSFMALFLLEDFDILFSSLNRMRIKARKVLVNYTRFVFLLKKDASLT